MSTGQAGTPPSPLPKSVSLTALGRAVTIGCGRRIARPSRLRWTSWSDTRRRGSAATTPPKPPASSLPLNSSTTQRDPVDGYAAPQLHTHAVIFNVTERENGSTRALQERAFFESQQYATAVYQSALTYQLRNLGYQIEPGRSGAPEIKGYSQEYLDASSPRSRQIKEQLEKSGYSGPEAAQIAAHSTRDRKQTLSAEEVLAAHKEMAAAFGNQPQQVIADRPHSRALQQNKEPEQNTLAKEAVTFARETYL